MHLKTGMCLCICLYVLLQQVLIIVKYIFQFNFYPWNQEDHELAIMDAVYIFGIEKKNDYAAFDLFLLFSLFIHRSILKVSKFCNAESLSLTPSSYYFSITEAVIVMLTAKYCVYFLFHY